MIAATLPEPDLTHTRPRRPAALIPTAVVLALTSALIALNPVGYVGGGADDWHYLEAARCVAEHGWCPPADHWAARWPVVQPLGVAIALFGDGRLALEVASVLPACVSLVLLVRIATRLGGPTAGIVAGAALALTPVFTLPALTASADLTELALLLAAVECGLASARGGGRQAAVAAGLCLGLAIATRETAATAILPLSLLWLTRPATRRPLLLGAAGAAVPLIAEAGWHLMMSGNALLRPILALRHVAIPSTELAGGMKTRSPLLNLDLVDRWKPASGIEVHWLVDPWLNLLVHPFCGLTLTGALALLLVARDRIGRTAWLLGGLATGMAIVLVYVLAADPKPRMFMPMIAAAALLIGLIVPRLWRDGRRLIAGMLLGLLVLKGVATIADRPGIARSEDLVPRWLAETGARPSMDELTRRYLTLAEGVRDRAPDGRTRLSIENGACRGATLRQASVVRDDPVLVGWLRSHGLLAGRAPERLCLYRIS